MIAVRGLTKRFGTRTVLDSIELDFTPGTVTALVGPNGAGKTTLLKCILGLVRPSEGSVRVAGAPTDERGRYRAQIGYMPQLPSFPSRMTGRELTAMLDDLRDFSGRPDEALAQAFDLHGELDKPIRTLSGGTRQKINASLAFRYQPPVLILDEPTAGLDPIASLALKEKVRQSRREGRTLLVTSHDLGDLETIADAVVFLHEGEVRFAGSVDRLLESTGRKTLEEAIADLMRDGSGPADRDEGDTPSATTRPPIEIVR